MPFSGHISNLFIFSAHVIAGRDYRPKGHYFLSTIFEYCLKDDASSLSPYLTTYFILYISVTHDYRYRHTKEGTKLYTAMPKVSATRSLNLT